MDRVLKKLKIRYSQVNEKELRRILESQISINLDLDELSIFERCIDEITRSNDSKFHQQSKQDTLEPINQQLDLGINQNATNSPNSEHGLAFVVKTSANNCHSSTELKDNFLNSGARPKIKVDIKSKQQTNTENTSSKTNVSVLHEVSKCTDIVKNQTCTIEQTSRKSAKNRSITAEQPSYPEERSGTNWPRDDRPVNAKSSWQKGPCFSHSRSQRRQRGGRHRGRMGQTRPRQLTNQTSHIKNHQTDSHSSIPNSHDFQHEFHPCNHQNYDIYYQSPDCRQKTQCNSQKPCYWRFQNHEDYQYQSSHSHRQLKHWRGCNNSYRMHVHNSCHHEHNHRIYNQSPCCHNSCQQRCNQCYDCCCEDKRITNDYPHRYQNNPQGHPFSRGVDRWRKPRPFGGQFRGQFRGRNGRSQYGRARNKAFNQNCLRRFETTRNNSPEIDEPLTEDSSIEARIKAIRKIFPNANESCVREALLNVDDIQDPVGFVINDFSSNGFSVKNDISYIQASTDRESTPEPPQPPPECGCCYIELTPETTVTCDVGHQFCGECLNSYVKEAAYGQGSIDIRCMAEDCFAIFPRIQMEIAVNEETFIKFEERRLEESIRMAKLEDLTSCPFCSFAAILAEDQEAFYCQRKDCGKVTCRSCGELWEEHLGLTCAQIEKDEEAKIRLDYEEQMSHVTIRRCERCGTGISKTDGCNHVTCRCGNYICYVCRKSISDYSHFGADRCQMFTTVEEDENRRLKELQQEAERIRNEQGYTKKRIIGVPDNV